MNIKKIVLIIAFWGVFISPFLINVHQVEALTTEEILVLIKALQEQIAQLQKQLEDTGEEVVWCYDFKNNLKYQDYGADIEALHTALEKEGFNIDISEKKGVASFERTTASAVTGFQEKYKKDVLAPWRLTYGTGFVGGTTRTKLNELYGCDEISDIEEPYLKIVSPNGGEKWAVGNIYKIKWGAKEIKEDFSIYLYVRPSDRAGGVEKLIGTVAFSLREYSWKIPVGTDIVPIEKGYKIKITSGEILDESDNYFSIVEATTTTCHTSDLWSWNYASLNCKGDAGEGDCDRDSDCNTGYCAMNVGVKYGQVSSMDVCEEKVEESITVTSPNGGEQLNIGQTYNITWNSTDVGKVDIHLEKWAGDDGQIYAGGPFTQIIDENVSTSLGWYSWLLGHIKEGSIAPAGNYYKIRIVKTGDTSSYSQQIADSSNNYFSIVEKTTAFWNWDYCTASSPCNVGEGDCDRDSDCNTGYCALNVGAKYGQVSSMDVCEEKEEVTSSITITSPNGGENIAINKKYTITWENTGSISYVDINLTKESWGSSGFVWIVKNALNTGSYIWDLSSTKFTSGIDLVKGEDYQIQITDSEDSSIWDLGDDYFSIVEKEKSITVVSPNGGEKWVAGQTYDINWNSSGMEKVVMSICGETNSCRELPGMGYGVDASLGKYSWAIDPNALWFPGNFKMRISSYTDLRVYDESDNYFSIVTQEEIPTTCHTSDLWSWNYASLNCKGDAEEGDCDRDSDCSTGYCALNVGAKYGQVSSMDVCEEKKVTPSITSFNYTETDAYSGSVKFSWTSTRADNVRFFIPCHSGLTITNAVTGANFSCGESDRKFSANTSLYLKLTNTSGALINTTATLVPIVQEVNYNNNSKTLNFSIVEATATTCHTSDLWSWNYASLNCKGDAGQGDCDRDSDCNTGYCALNVGTKYGQVSSMDVCEEKEEVTSSITITSPNGGEQWKTDEIHTIKWTSVGHDSNASIKIGLRDTSYDPNVSAGEATIINTTNNGSYTWTIPSDPSDLGFEGFGAGNVYKIVIYLADGGPGKFDLSDNYFSIVAEQKSITVISPNGGVSWKIGKTYDIAWNFSGNIPKINIEIWKASLGSGGLSYIAKDIDNTGSYSWDTTQPFVFVPYSLSELIEGDDYKIYVRDSSNSSIFDRSDNYFSIVQSGSLSISLSPETPFAQNIVKGSTNVTFLRAIFAVNNVEDIKVNRITVYPYKNRTIDLASPADIANLKLYDGSTQIGLTYQQQLSQYNYVVFSDLNWTIPRGTSKTLTVKIDIPTTSTLTSLKTTIYGGAVMEATGVTSGSPIQALLQAEGNWMTITSPFSETTELKSIEDQLASISEAISHLLGNIEELLK